MLSSEIFGVGHEQVVNGELNTPRRQQSRRAVVASFCGWKRGASFVARLVT